MIASSLLQPSPSRQVAKIQRHSFEFSDVATLKREVRELRAQNEEMQAECARKQYTINELRAESNYKDQLMDVLREEKMHKQKEIDIIVAKGLHKRPRMRDGASYDG